MSVSKLGYSKGSPYRNRKSLTINTPGGLIDMSNTDIPLYAQDETGFAKILPPHSGMHQFPGTKVTETRMNPYMQKGGSANYEFLFGDDEEEDAPATAPTETEAEQDDPQTARVRKQMRDMQQQGADDLAMVEAMRGSYEMQEPQDEEAEELDSRARASATGNPYSGPAVNVNDSATRAFEYYQGKGIAPHIAAGIVGNLIQESQLNPNAKGDGGRATGIAQWHPDRFEALKTWAGRRNPYELNTQLDYILHEANQRGDMDRLQQTKNSSEAAFTFAKYYERPKNIEPVRMGYAQRLYPNQQMGGSLQDMVKEILNY